MLNCFFLGAVYVPLSRAVLPPIRGTQQAADPEKKQAPQEEEAGEFTAVEGCIIHGFPFILTFCF